MRIIVCQLHKEEMWIIIIGVITWRLSTSICKVLPEGVGVIICETVEMSVWLGQLIVINGDDSHGNRNCKSIFDIVFICLNVASMYWIYMTINCIQYMRLGSSLWSR